MNLVANSDIIALKEAYDFWQSKSFDEYGPLRMFSHSDGEEIKKIWDCQIAPAIQLVDNSVKKVKNGVYKAQAPSPWHAYFYLRAAQQYQYRSGRRFGTPLDNLNEKIGEHVFFRGQRCSKWDFKSSLQRKTDLEQKIEERAIFALSEYFKNHFIADEDVASISARCFAQHYGIATNLVDVTCVPDIAIWFATHPTNKSCPDNEECGVVRMITWAGQKTGGSETVFFLPPPFIRNIYLQRGLFIDTASTDGVANSNLIFDVEFPRDTVGGEFQVLRENSQFEVWPAVDQSEQELIDWSRHIASRTYDISSVKKEVAIERANGTHPNFWLTRELYDLEKYTTEWVSILDWVFPFTCITALPLSSTDNKLRFEILNQKLNALVTANPTFFRAYVYTFEVANFEGHEYNELVYNLVRKQLETLKIDI